MTPFQSFLQFTIFTILQFKQATLVKRGLFSMQFGKALLLAALLLFFSIPGKCNRVDSLQRLLAANKDANEARVELLIQLSVAFDNVQTDSQVAYARKALALAQQVNSPKSIAASQGQLGYAYFSAGIYDSSLYYNQLSIDLARKTGMRKMLAARFNSIASTYQRQGNIARAMPFYDSAIAHARSTKDTIEEARTLNNKANAHFEQGSYILALRSYLRCLNIYEKLGTKNDMESALLNITNVFFRLKQYDKAKDYAARAMGLAAQSGSKWSVLSVHTTYAMIFNEEKKYDSSLAHLQIALGLATEANNPYAINIVKSNIAECYLNMNDLAHAEPLYRESLVMSTQMNDLLGIGIAKGGLGQILVRQGKPQAGVGYLEEAFGTLRANGMKEQAMAIADTLSMVLYQLGDFKGAMQYKIARDAYRDSLSRYRAGAEAESMEYDYQLKRKEEQIQLLEKDKALEESKVVLNRVLLIMAVIGMLLASVIAFQFFRNTRNIKKSRTLILRQKMELEEQAKKLAQLNEMKNTTFSVLSHDLRSPINALTGTMSMLDEGIITPEEFGQYKNELNNKLQSVTLMLDNMLQWAKGQMKGEQSVDIERVSLKHKVTRAYGVVKDAAEQKNIHVSIGVPEQLYAYADKNQVEMVIRNLLSNAVKFTPQNGQITVSARKDGDNVLLYVADNGVGMTPEQVASLFDTSAHSTTVGTGGERGTGIGMNLSYEFVKANGGDITVKSAPGQGTTFVVKLPAFERH